MEATYHLQQIRDKESVQLSLFDSLKRKNRSSVASNRASLVASKRLSARSQQVYEPYKFEVPPPDVDSQEGSIHSSNSVRNSGTLSAVMAAMSNLSEGKVEFGEVDNLETTLDYRLAAEQLHQDNNISIAEHLGRAQNALMLAWSLAATHCGLWTVEHEMVAEHIADNLVKLFSAVLQFRSKRLRELGVTMATVLHGARRASSSTDTGQPSHKFNRRLLLVLNLYKSVLQLVRFDALGRHLMVVAVKFALDTTQTLMSSKAFTQKSLAWQGLYGCYTLLSFSEEALSRVYVSVPSLLPWYNQLPTQLRDQHSDVFQNSVLVFLKRLYSDQTVPSDSEGGQNRDSLAIQGPSDSQDVSTKNQEKRVAELNGYAR